MASSSGISSGSSQIQSSGSEEDLQQLMDLRKRKRMISNRESARRSRMRKQKHLDDLMAHMCQMKAENGHILTNTNVTAQMYLKLEAENSVLRAQMAELSHRLQSLNEIVAAVSSNAWLFESDHQDVHLDHQINGDDLLGPCNLLYVNQPILASANMFMY